MDKIWDDIVNFFNTTGSKVLFVLCVLVLAGLAIHYLVKGLKILLYRTSIDDSVVSFVASLLKILLWLILIFVCAGILNLSTSSLVVCLSSVALAVGLALKDSFANLTNGLFIIYNKPFKRGDLIKIGDITGVVQNIKLLSTELVSLDNCKLVIPNSKINNESVINYYAMPVRRVDKVFSVSYGTDSNLVLATIKEVLANNEFVIKYPESKIFMSSHGSSSVDFTIWAWVSTEDYWPFWMGIQQEIYEAFYKYGISIPFPQVDVHFDDKKKEQISFPTPEGYSEIIATAKEKEEKIKKHKLSEKKIKEEQEHKEQELEDILNDNANKHKEPKILKELKEKTLKVFSKSSKKNKEKNSSINDKKQLEQLNEDLTQKSGAEILKEIKEREKKAERDENEN